MAKKFVRSMFSMLGAAAMMLPFGLEAEARADTVQICTFSADTAGINYHDGYSRGPMAFSWNNSTGEVISATWKPAASGTVEYAMVSSTPSSVASGYDASGTITSMSNFELQMARTDLPAAQVILRGTIANKSTTAGATVLSGIYYGTSNSWLAGYGTVSCVTQ